MTPPLGGAAGTYRCHLCDRDLFHTDAEFEFGTGCWPNFSEPLPGAVAVRERTAGTNTGHELRCATCNSYVGQLFSDGPGRAAERYCVEWGAVRFLRANAISDDAASATSPPAPTAGPANAPAPTAGPA
jgi:peptide methionine sulfoxide reductase MsrB